MTQDTDCLGLHTNRSITLIFVVFFRCSRYSLPSRNSGAGSGGGSLPASPINGSNSKFKYATASVSEQPVNLALGSPSTASSPISSPQSMPHSAMDKMTFDFMYNRHAAAAAAGIFPQSYHMLYSGAPPPQFGNQPQPPQSMKQSSKGAPDPSTTSMSPPGNPADRNANGNEVIVGSQRYQLQSPFHAGHGQKTLKGSTAVGNNVPGFLLPPPAPAMMTQAELEALHAYHERLYYNSHGPPTTDHMLNTQRLQQSPNMQSPVMTRSHPQPPPLTQHSTTGKRAIVDTQGGYHPQQQQQINHRPHIGSGGKHQDKNNNLGFKVPSGKEGSMKHRMMSCKSSGKGRAKHGDVKGGAIGNHR